MTVAEKIRRQFIWAVLSSSSEPRSELEKVEALVEFLKREAIAPFKKEDEVRAKHYIEILIERAKNHAITALAAEELLCELVSAAAGSRAQFLVMLDVAE